MSDVFTENERRYLFGFKPAGFLRAWNAMYETKCIVQPRDLSHPRWGLAWLAVERGNRWPSIGRTLFAPDVWGWHVILPCGAGTLALWGYWRAR